METDNPFEKVLNRLREKGWQKGRFGQQHGPNCIRGAASWLGLDEWCVVTPAIRLIVLAQYAERAPNPERRESVAMFNDHPETTFSNVERVLEKAAVKWEEERALRDD